MKRNTIMSFIGTVMLVILCIRLVDYAAILKPDDTTAEGLKWKSHMNRTIEGSFLDTNGEVIFKPEKPYTEDKSHLPVEYSYILGYNHKYYGSSGLRKKYQTHLYTDYDTGTGGSIQLTIDNVLQSKAYSVLKESDFSGSVIVMDAKTGEILAMAGRRSVDFDLNDLPKNWADYNKVQGVFVNPATGDYKAPGSVFKMLTSAAAIMGGMSDYRYYDTGTLIVNGKKMNNAKNKVYYDQGLQEALSTSTNTYFGSLSLELGERAMRGIFKDFLVGENLDLGFTVLKSAANFDGSDLNLAMMGFGQGGLALSPLHIAMIAQSVVNDGKMLYPTLIKTMYDANGNAIFRNNTRNVLANTIKPEMAREVKELMRGVTQYNEKSWENYTQNVYSKTGTAQKDGSKLHNSYYLCMTDDYVILASVNDTPLYGTNLAYIIDSFLRELY